MVSDLFLQDKGNPLNQLTIQPSPAMARYLPFAVFMAFIGLEELLRFLSGRGFITVSPDQLLYLYPVKVVVVVGILYRYRKQYQELVWRDLLRLPESLAVVMIGLLVFLLWINLDWAVPGVPSGQGYSPLLLPPALQLPMIVMRMIGAVLVVPVMEELFWRSFLLRYICDAHFEKVPLGHFTWASFVISSVLFGFEHHLVLAGIVAGIFYNLVLYETRSLAQCILAHAVTNFALALFVLISGRWDLW